MHSKIFQFFLFECIQGTKVILVLRVQRRMLFLSMSSIYTCRNIEFLMSEPRLQYYNANCVGGG